MSITTYNSSLIVIPASIHMGFKPRYMNHIALRYERSNCDDHTMRWMNFRMACTMVVLGPLVVLPGRIVFAVWNLAMTLFSGIACLGTMGSMQSLNHCCWKAMIDAFSEIYALAAFLIALPILTTLSLLGAVVHPALSAPAWWMMKGLSMPLKEVRDQL